MKRPLVWFGLAIVFGEILGFMNSWICIVGFLLTILSVIYTGRKAKINGRKWLIYLLLPVFCFLGVGATYRVVKMENWQVTHIGDIPKEFRGEILSMEASSNGLVGQLRYQGVTIILYFDQSRQSAFSNTQWEDLASLCPGDFIGISGKVELFEHARNPGCYDAYDTWRQKNIFYCMYNPEIIDISKKSSTYVRWLYCVKKGWKTVLYKVLSERNAGMMSGLLLGDTSGMDSEIKSMYQAQGIGHIFAVSGLHMSIVGMGLFRLLRRIYLPISLAALLTGGVVYSYGIMCGMHTSAIRAVVLLILLLISKCIGRTYDTYTALVIAGTLMLIDQPRLLSNFSFLMSFGCAIFFIMLQLFKKHTKKSTKIFSKEPMKKSKKWSSIMESFLLYLFNIPILAWFQYEIPLYSAFLNLIIVPCVSVVFPIGLAGVCFGSLYFPAARLILPVCDWTLIMIEKIVRLFQDLPLAMLVTGKPALWIVLLTEISLILVMCHRGRLRYLILLSYMLLILKLPSDELRIIYVDVGQGDCNILWSPNGETTIIDGGSSSKSQVGKYVIEKVLKYYGTTVIDRVILTHMDQDHINGVMELLEREYPIRHIYISEAEAESEKIKIISEEAEKQHISIHTMKQGDQFLWGNLKVCCVLPNQMNKDVVSDNDKSIVLDMYYGENHLLFTGDITSELDEILCENLGKSKPVDLLKVAHHGSKYSTSEKFLNVVRPTWAIISCGENNRYGHPHQETLERLQNVNSKICCTAEKGAVLVKMDTKRYKVFTFLE